ncbi:MAG: amidohydrolase family protein [Acidimicrobiia bacterium]
MKIDVFGHGMAPELRNRVLEKVGSPPSLANWVDLRPLFEHRERIRVLDANDIDIQVLTTPSPPLESLFAGEALRRMTKLANDSMAVMVDAARDRIRGTVSVPLCDPEFAVAELRRGVETLGLLGPQIFTSSLGVPLDDPSLEPFWSEVSRLGVPAWLHPERRADKPDYPGEDASRYGLFLVLGWPYESSVAMARLVFSGVLERHPDLEIIVHHAGAMIPFFAQRISSRYPEGEELGRIDRPQLEGPLMDGFRRFHVDTAIHGPVSALMCSYDLYGAGHMLLGTDAPFGPDNGLEFCRLGSTLIDEMPIPEPEREMIRSQNAIELCRIV